MSIKILIFSLTLYLINSLKLKMDGKQKKYCFLKSIYQSQDSLKISYLVSSLGAERVDILVTEKFTGREIYRSRNRDNGNYQTPLLNSGDYELCIYPHSQNKFYVTFDFSSQTQSSVLNGLAVDKEVKNMEYGVLELDRLFKNFQEQLNFIIDRRNHHTTILSEIVGEIKIISTIKILILICLSVFQVFVIKKFFGTEKRVTKIKGTFGNNDTL